MRGRKPKSPEQQALSGYAGKRSKENSLPAEELKPLDNVWLNEFYPPPELSKEAAKIWNTIIKRNADHGLLRPSDIPALTVLCDVIERRNLLKKNLDKNGYTYSATTASGTIYRKRPEVDIIQNCEKLISTYTTNLSMTISSRTRTLAAGLQSKQYALPGLEPPASQPSGVTPVNHDDPIGFITRSSSSLN